MGENVIHKNLLFVINLDNLWLFVILKNPLVCAGSMSFVFMEWICGNPCITWMVLCTGERLQGKQGCRTRTSRDAECTASIHSKSQQTAGRVILHQALWWSCLPFSSLNSLCTPLTLKKVYAVPNYPIDDKISFTLEKADWEWYLTALVYGIGWKVAQIETSTSTQTWHCSHIIWHQNKHNGVVQS